MDRRSFLNKSLVTGLIFNTLPSIANKKENHQKAFRIVHLTDTHIFPSAKVEQAIGQLLNDIHSMEEKPDFILNTGDHIMDALKKPKNEVHQQWQSWSAYLKDQLKFPMYSCIGNHDIWGWSLDDNVIKKDPLFGKPWAMSMLGLSERFYSFEHKGWKFICLDSSYYAEGKNTYTAKLDSEQFTWLEAELKNSSPETPICIASHIPILSASVFYDGDNAVKGEWEVPRAWMHIDSKQIKDLFYKYPNVKAALSGHVHLADKTEYLGINYHCNGAVCGGWWKGNYQEFGPSYAVVDFYDDGTIHTDLISY